MDKFYFEFKNELLLQSKLVPCEGRGVVPESDQSQLINMLIKV